MVTITDTNGNAISWASAGGMGFRGSQARAPRLRAQTAAETAATRCHGARPARPWRFSSRAPARAAKAAIRALQTAGLEVTMIKDVTPIPHNGCRPPKRRRV